MASDPPPSSRKPENDPSPAKPASGDPAAAGSSSTKPEVPRPVPPVASPPPVGPSPAREQSQPISRAAEEPPSSKPVVESEPSRLRRGAKKAEYIFIGLMVMSLLGLAITQAQPIWGFWYWLAMVPLFGGLYVFLRWPHLSREGGHRRKFLAAQALHWGAAAGAIVIVFVMQQRATFPPEEAALISLLVLALTSFSAGVQGGWRFAAVGVLLGLLVLGAGYFERNLWLLVLVGAVLTIAIFFGARAIRRRGGADSTSRP